MTNNDCVLIAGAGPVGMTTALALAKASIPVKIFDTLGNIPADHRASTLHPSTLMMVEELGMTPELLRRGIESLGPDVYEKLSYYERWAASAALNAIEQGLVTQVELDARIEAMRRARDDGA